MSVLDHLPLTAEAFSGQHLTYKLVLTLVLSFVAGKWLGIVTDMQVSHASVAAAYAHSPSDKWHSDADIPRTKRINCVDVVKQFFFASHMFKVS